MPKLFTLTAIVLATLLPVVSTGQKASQTRNISGKVFDENGKLFLDYSVIARVILNIFKLVQEQQIKKLR